MGVLVSRHKETPCRDNLRELYRSRILKNVKVRDAKEGLGGGGVSH